MRDWSLDGPASTATSRCIPILSPYFPRTGFFIANQYYDIDPTGFDIAGLFAALAPPPI